MSLNKKWMISVVCITAALLILVGGIIVVVDPFFHYHKPLPGISYPIRNEAYTNPGLARHFEYDSILSGSSVTELFRPSWFKTLMGLDTIKVPYSGAFSSKINTIVGFALQKKENVKTVFWGLDYYALGHEGEDTRVLPDFLYDDELLNDVNYLLNKTVLLNGVSANLWATLAGEPTNFDTAYDWESEYTFGRKAVLEAYQPPEKSTTAIPATYFIPTVKKDLETNIIPLVENNPGVEFVFFFPPSSILWWYDRVQGNLLDATICELEYVSERLLSYDNVKVFFFQNAEEIVTNLDNYKDRYHYSSAVNYYMTECFSNDAHLLTKDNYLAEAAKMKALATGFDYAALLNSVK